MKRYELTNTASFGSYTECLEMVPDIDGEWVRYEDAIDRATSMYKKGKEDAELKYEQKCSDCFRSGKRTGKIEKCPECGEQFTDRQDRYTDGEWARSQSYGCPNNCDQLDDASRRLTTEKEEGE